MRVKRQARDTPLFTAGFAALFVVAACSGMGSKASLLPTDSLAAQPVPTHSSAPSAQAPSETTGSCGSATISIDYAPYTTATLAGYGWDFVVAEVVGFGPAIFNTPDGSRPSEFPSQPTFPRPNNNAENLIYTPVNVDVDRAISGPWSPGPGQFLVEGGTVLLENGPVGCFEMRVSPVPQVEPGSRYVFILSEALDSGGENPLPLRKARFAWPFGQAGKVVTIDGLLSLDELIEIVVNATATPEPY